jgi:hypothetical protein
MTVSCNQSSVCVRSASALKSAHARAAGVRARAAALEIKLRAPLSGTDARGRGRGVSPLSLAPAHSGLAPVTRPLAGAPPLELAGAVRAVPASFQARDNAPGNLSNRLHKSRSFRARINTRKAGTCLGSKLPQQGEIV